MSAADILNAALDHMKDRAATYDKPEGERSMGATVDAFTAVTGVCMTEEQGWLFMALLKAVRSQQGAYRADSYEDGAAYFALAGEAAVRDRNGGWTDKAIKGAALSSRIEPVEEEPASASSFAERLEQFVHDADERLNTEYNRILAEQQELARPSMDSFLRTVPAEPASAIDDESEHYGAPDWSRAPDNAVLYIDWAESAAGFASSFYCDGGDRFYRLRHGVEASTYVLKREDGLPDIDYPYYMRHTK